MDEVGHCPVERVKYHRVAKDDYSPRHGSSGQRVDTREEVVRVFVRGSPQVDQQQKVAPITQVKEKVGILVAAVRPEPQEQQREGAERVVVGHEPLVATDEEREQNDVPHGQQEHDLVASLDVRAVGSVAFALQGRVDLQLGHCLGPVHVAFLPVLLFLRGLLLLTV